MKKIIKAQFEKIADILPKLDENVTHFVVNKRCNVVNSAFGFKENSYYIVELENYLLLPPNSQFTLHANWNGGVVPKEKVMRCEVVKLLGKMIKLNGIGFNTATNTDTNNAWCGWLPASGVKILREL